MSCASYHDIPERGWKGETSGASYASLERAHGVVTAGKRGLNSTVEGATEWSKEQTSLASWVLFFMFNAPIRWLRTAWQWTCAYEECFVPYPVCASIKVMRRHEIALHGRSTLTLGHGNGTIYGVTYSVHIIRLWITPYAGPHPQNHVLGNPSANETCCGEFGKTMAFSISFAASAAIDEKPLSQLEHDIERLENHLREWPDARQSLSPPFAPFADDAAQCSSNKYIYNTIVLQKTRRSHVALDLRECLGLMPRNSSPYPLRSTLSTSPWNYLWISGSVRGSYNGGCRMHLTPDSALRTQLKKERGGDRTEADKNEVECVGTGLLNKRFQASLQNTFWTTATSGCESSSFMPDGRNTCTANISSQGAATPNPLGITSHQ